MENGEEVLRKEGCFGSVGGHQGTCAECLDEEFDIVVVAAPQTRDKTKIAGVKYQKQKKTNGFNKCVNFRETC